MGDKTAASKNWWFLRHFVLLFAGKYKYKRYNGLPLRYAGGKSLAVGHIVENLPDHISCLVSPFFGGGSVEIACAKELGINVRGYDVFAILAQYWQMQTTNPQKLAARLKKWQPTPKRYDAVKARLRAHWQGSKPIEDNLELAAHYWFNHNLSYGPGFLGWMSKIYECPSRYKRLLKKVEDFSCPKLSVRHIVENLPDHISCLVSPFFGGGSVEIACAKELGINVRGYDVFAILAQYWQMQTTNPQKLAARLKKWQPTPKRYDAVKARLRAHWQGSKPIEDNLELAAHYWFNHNLSYGPETAFWDGCLKYMNARLATSDC